MLHKISQIQKTYILLHSIYVMSGKDKSAGTENQSVVARDTLRLLLLTLRWVPLGQSTFSSLVCPALPTSTRNTPPTRALRLKLLHSAESVLLLLHLLSFSRIVLTFFF